MTKLEQVEQLRKELVRKILEITGLTVDCVQVEVTFHNQGEDTQLGMEARQIGWHKDSNDGSIWYTSEPPSDGGVTVFVEEFEIEDDPPHAGNDW